MQLELSEELADLKKCFVDTYLWTFVLIEVDCCGATIEIFFWVMAGSVGWVGSFPGGSPVAGDCVS